MDTTAALSYIYAKLSGMLAKSYVGVRTQKLFAVSSLQEVWSLLFKDDVPSVPEAFLAQRIEQKATEQFIAEYSSIIELFDKPQSLLVELLHSLLL